MDNLLISSVLEESKKLLYVDTMVKGMKINYSKRYPFIAPIILESEFTPIAFFD